MRSTFAFHLLCATLLAGRTRAVAVETCSTNPQDGWSVGKAVYLQSNEDLNSIISIPIGHDGKLYGGVVTTTGGAGGNSIDGTTNMPAAPDALSSQGSVIVVDKYLFAVNAGSNSLSMFSIDDHDPTGLYRVGEPSALPGDFPVTVAASLKRRKVCVGYTGAKAGVSCAFFSPRGLGPAEETLKFELQQTTPPVGPTNTIAQVFFAANDSRLITTVKGDPMTNKTGFLSVLPFNDSHSSSFHTRDTRTSPPGTAVLFGGVNAPGPHDLLLTDASFGATLLKLDPATDKISVQQKTIINGQQATCWAAYSEARESFFLTDVAVNRLIELGADGSEIISSLDLNSGDPGLTDIQVSGRFVYALSPGNGTTTPAAITVVDSFQGRQIQHFVLDRLGAGKRSQGLAILE